jgi:hypothetical protein
VKTWQCNSTSVWKHTVSVTKLTLDRLSQICEVLESNIMEILQERNDKYNIKEVKDKATAVNNGTIKHQEISAEQQSIVQQTQAQNQSLLKQIEMLITMNQQLIEQYTQLKHSLQIPSARPTTQVTANTHI